jgi:AcrR family transcriptional regulator
MGDQAGADMTDLTPAPPGRRRHDAAASRQALLEAAAVLFDERGYDAATVRDIAERAGVDAALIARYFGSKEGLYIAAVSQQGRPVLPTDMHALLEALLVRSQAQGTGPVMRAMVGPSLSDAMREQIETVMSERVTGPLTRELEAAGIPDAALRAELLFGLSIGILLARESRILPALAGASLEEILEVLSPLLDALQG